MALKAIMQWKNLDSTRDLNARFKALFHKGVIEGGLISPVVGDLQVDVLPFSAFSSDGMLVQNDVAERLTIPVDQTSVLSILARHQIGEPPVLEYHVTEISIFNALIDVADHIVFGTVTVNSPATEVASGDISYSRKDIQDKRGRSSFRGHVSEVAQLPLDPRFNLPGDYFMINMGVGDIPELYAWNGLTWVNITQTLSLSSDLNQHRANLFPNEIHLTDSQADAALGTFGSPSITNRYITNLDPRIPTQNQKDALAGSHGTPSTSNKYVTEQYPIAAPTALSFPLAPGGSITMSASEGPFYVGKGGLGTANKYFFLIDLTDLKGYLNSVNIAANVTGVFKDPLLTSDLNPLLDTDVEGFFTGDLYLQVDNLIDTGLRVVYGKRSALQNLPRDFSVVPTPGDALVPASVVEKIANIKGYPFDTLIPQEEQNVTLRKDINDLATYVGSVLETNVVAADEDFTRLSNDPVFGPLFEKNIGINPTYTFQNTALTSFTYNSSLGRVTFSSPVNLSAVVIGNLFQDGAGNKYRVVAVNDASDFLDIVSLETGEIASSIVTSVGTLVDGSVQENANPRDVLLSEMKLNFHSEKISTTKLEPLKDEFSKPDGGQAYGVKRYDNRFEPRLVFYGGFENYKDTNGQEYVRNAGDNGEIMITGFFTGVSLLLRRKNNSPALSVSVNGKAPTTVSTSALNTVNSNVAQSEGPKYHRLVLVQGLPANQSTTVSAKIFAATLGSLDVYGVEVFRADSETNGILESGRAFESARVVKRDALSTVTTSPIDTGERGARVVYGVEENSFSFVQNALLDLDKASTPAGTVTGTTITITTGLGKLTRYRQNDIIMLSNGLVAEMRRIVSVVSNTVTIDVASSIAGSLFLKHIASTDSTIPNPGEEERVATYTILRDFVNGTTTDFSAQDTRNRFVMHKDGHTLISGRDITVAKDDLIGATSAARLESTGILKFKVTCSRLDVIAANELSDTVAISIDGSPFYPYTFSGGGLKRHTIFFNSRYQDHEVVIQGGSGNLALTQLILFAPQKPSFPTLVNEVADLVRPASYSPSLSYFVAAPQQHPTGAVFYEDHHYITKINGTGANPDWDVSFDYTKSPYGPYVATENDGAKAEFYFLGEAFEVQYITGPDHGIFTVAVDGVPLELTGGTIVGNYTSNQVDAFSASYGRRNIGAHNLSFGYHKVEVSIKTPRTTTSVGYKLALVGFYVGNTGHMSFGLDRNGTYNSVVDLRNFIPLPVKEMPQVAASLDTRTGKINLTAGTTSTVVSLPRPFADANYVITANMHNATDMSPLYQPLVITGQTVTDFNVSWNMPLPTANYVLNYVAIKL
jgi:hypothetical protein